MSAVLDAEDDDDSTSFGFTCTGATVSPVLAGGVVTSAAAAAVDDSGTAFNMLAGGVGASPFIDRDAAADDVRFRFSLR